MLILNHLHLLYSKSTTLKRNKTSRYHSITFIIFSFTSFYQIRFPNHYNYQQIHLQMITYLLSSHLQMLYQVTYSNINTLMYINYNIYIIIKQNGRSSWIKYMKKKDFRSRKNKTSRTYDKKSTCTNQLNKNNVRQNKGKRTLNTINFNSSYMNLTYQLDLQNTPKKLFPKVNYVNIYYYTFLTILFLLL